MDEFKTLVGGGLDFQAFFRDYQKTYTNGAPIVEA